MPSPVTKKARGHPRNPEVAEAEEGAPAGFVEPCMDKGAPPLPWAGDDGVKLSPNDADALERDDERPYASPGKLHENPECVDNGAPEDNFFEICRRISMHSSVGGTVQGGETEIPAGNLAQSTEKDKPDEAPPSTSLSEQPKQRRDVVEWPGPQTGPSMFDGITMMFVHNTKQQYEIWSRRAQDLGATVVTELTDGVHIVVSDYSYALIAKKALRVVPECTRVLKTAWIMRCLRDKVLAPYAEYDAFIQEKAGASPQKTQDRSTRAPSDSLKGSHSSSHRSEIPLGSSSGTSTSKQIARDSTQGSDGNGFDDVVERDVFYNDTRALTKIVAKQQHMSEEKAQRMLEKRTIAFACTKEVGPRENYVGCVNQGIVDMLQECSNQRKIDKDPKQRIKQVMYTKCIAQIKQLGYKITLANVDNLIKVKNIGEAAIRKMKEYLSSEDGSIRRIRDPPEYVKVTQLFQTIWGVGPTMAGELYRMGFRTIDDVRKEKDSVLNSQQLIGLKHIDDFNEKIPRAEVASIEEFVTREAKKLFGRDTTVAITGSYRRGKDKSGDCDVLITRPNGVPVENVVQELVEHLSAIGFITDRLTSVKEDAVGKFMGVCKIFEKFRRIDLLAVPNHQFAFALLYFTGSGHFNRSMRLWCKKHGLHLSGTELTQVERNRFGDIVHTIESYACFTEREIFEACGLPYVAPNQRNI